MQTTEYDKQKLGKYEGYGSLILNIFLFVIKYIAGILSGSIALIADAWHTLSDSVSSLIIIIGFYISKKPADNHRPFGYERAETIASIIVGVLLAVVAFNFFIESIHRLQSHKAVNYGTLAITVTIISIILKEAMAQYAFWAGKKTNSSALKADGWHHRSDAISSVVILAGIFLQKYAWWIDGLLGILVSILIGYASFSILRSAILPLLGESPDGDTVSHILELSEKHCPLGDHLHHFHIHRYGNHTELTFHMRLPSDMPIEKAHQLVDQLEKTIKEQLDIYATIHIEPYVEE